MCRPLRTTPNPKSKRKYQPELRQEMLRDGFVGFWEVYERMRVPHHSLKKWFSKHSDAIRINGTRYFISIKVLREFLERREDEVRLAYMEEMLVALQAE